MAENVVVKYSEEYSKDRRRALRWWWFFVLIAPLIFLWLWRTLKGLGVPRGPVFHADWLFYVLLIMAAAYPLLAPWFEREMAMGKQGKRRWTPGKRYHSVVLFKSALAGMPFAYAMLLYAYTAREYFWYFYPIGIVWTIVFWPTKARFEAFMEKAQAAHA